MGGVRADASILFPLVLDRIADERKPSDLRAVSRALELIHLEPTHSSTTNCLCPATFAIIVTLAVSNELTGASAEA